MRKFFLTTVISALVFAVRAAELDALLSDPKVWEKTAQQIVGEHPDLKIGWTASDHKSAKLLEKTLLFEMPLDEVVIQMDSERPVEFNIVFYNHGDTGDITRERLSTIVSNAQQKIATWMGTKPALANDQLKTTGVRRDGLVWTNGTIETRLAWSYSTKDPSGRLGFRAEYVKMRVISVAARSGKPSLAAGTVSAGALKSKIKRDPSTGEVLLDAIPMVDQGEKGYCAVASAERVMRFYGMSVDQHELAQLAASSAQGGTDPRAMLESLRRVGIKLGCKVKVVEDFSVPEFLRLIDRYNQAAKKKKKSEIKVGHEIDLGEVYASMDTEILRDIRTKSQQDLKNFMTDVTKNIDAAIPLLWGVQLGKVPEKPELPKQTSGGHLRLIIGYNPKTTEILYTDSWGPGHELKRMPLADAWTITCSLFVIEPRHTTI